MLRRRIHPYYRALPTLPITLGPTVAATGIQDDLNGRRRQPSPLDRYYQSAPAPLCLRWNAMRTTALAEGGVHNVDSGKLVWREPVKRSMLEATLACLPWIAPTAARAG